VIDPIVAGAVSFGSTNIDDLVILRSLLADPAQSKRHVLIGHCVGMCILIGVSLVGSFAAMATPNRICLPGLGPIAIGLSKIKKNWSAGTRDIVTPNNPQCMRHPIFLVIFTVVGAWGDNIGTYIPLYSDYPSVDRAVIVGIYFATTAAWCRLALVIVKHPIFAPALHTWGVRLTPFVLIAFGLHVLFASPGL